MCTRKEHVEIVEIHIILPFKNQYFNNPPKVYPQLKQELNKAFSLMTNHKDQTSFYYSLLFADYLATFFIFKKMANLENMINK
ncbi:hypothetical protein BpHYR1_010415 [Brachionus plicatilis]|uniref:Uncharacterized protein n=1 Tax=Brachionus plicatilis TaxID=10195 RepID=A0A3M7T2I4_BRAPC|nr:hypothetical protein BpHYR1_010415 [Brachionus plicatilis]